MPGRLGRNLRGGHRAEGLGIELLRALCAVAPVPQTEDIGFDAVATVLRVDGRFLKAGQSFCVQFKARSVRTISYDQAAYEWLRTLDLPLFIGSVDVKSQEVALYTTHNVVCRIDAQHYRSVVVRLNPPSHVEDNVLHEYLGEPILRWTHREAESEEFQKQAYSVLAAWVAIEQLHHPLRSIKTTQMVRWQTNEVPSTNGTMLTGYPGDLRHDIEVAAPYLMKVGSHFLMQEAPTPEAVAFLLLAKWFKDNGVEDFKYVALMLALRFTSQGQSLSLSSRIGNDQ